MAFGVVGDVNWLAVAVATFAYYLLGALWYAPPVFGRRWMRSLGWEMAEGERPGAATYIAPLITCLVACTAVAMLAASTNSDTMQEGLLLGFVVGVGLSAAILFVTEALDPKKPRPMTYFGITAGYHLVGLLIASVLVSVWR